jgi:uncharacterized protein
MRCDYCYYLDKIQLFSASTLRMPETLLEEYIAQRFEASPGPNTHFEWHGGEPTLLGLDYFRKITQLQRKYKPEGRTISNGLQTNGLLINAEWADFLSQEQFSVGLSLDGPKELHDGFRKTADSCSTHSQVVHAFRLLKERQVFCNVLCVLHSVNTIQPDMLYDFFRDIGAKYLQFLPLVGRGEASAKPEEIGSFLCRIFDRWIREDVGRMVIQTFDEALRPIYGIPHALCIHRETCGDVPVLEHDGSFYACDHFVDQEHLIGNIKERRLYDLSNDPKMTAFGRAKRDTLPRVCRECEVLSFCNGGCPKDRIARALDGEGGLNYLCPAYKAFFLHARPELTRLAAHMKAGKSLRAFKAI